MHFISLLEAVSCLAENVPTPDAWKNGVLKHEEIVATPFIDRLGRPHFSEVTHRFKVEMINNLFLSAFRTSEAAAALDQYLHNELPHGPRWFDRGETGRPKFSEAAREEAMPLLVHMSRYFDRYVSAYRSGRFDTWPISDEIEFNQGKFRNPADVQRLNEVGFERTELVSFLDRNGIPHSFHSSLLCDAETAPSSDPGPHFPSIPATKTYIAKKKRRNSLDSAIDKAIELAGGTHKTADVHQALKELALAGAPPFNGIIGKTGAMKYTDDKNNLRELTKSQLDGRLIRRWKALGYSDQRR